MAVLGLLLVLSAAGLTLDVIMQNATSMNVDALGQTLSISPGWLFAAGVATGAVGLLGLTLLFGGMTRARHRRAALAEARGTTQALRAERDRLAAQLDHERADRTAKSPTPHQTLGAPPADTNAPSVDLTREEGRPDPTSAADHEAVAVGRHGLFHRRED